MESLLKPSHSLAMMLAGMRGGLLPLLGGSTWVLSCASKEPMLRKFDSFNVEHPKGSDIWSLQLWAELKEVTDERRRNIP